ncbi:MAG: FAD:protein FMN transferase [Pseudomonadota bacterium]
MSGFIKDTHLIKAALLSLVLFVGLLAAERSVAEWTGTTEALMGTRVSVRLWHPIKERGDAAVRAAIAEIDRIERMMSTYKPDSQISAINREAHLGPVKTERELFDVIDRALAMSRMTGGRFDITYDSVGKYYDFREGKKPDALTIEAELENIDYRFVRLNAAEQTVAFAQEGVRINLGGIAKGYAVERAVQVLREAGIQYASVSAGGDSRLLGDHRGEPWIIGIQDPRDKKGLAVRLPLADEAVSTSGDYERYFDEGGVRYHHIIKPSTGKSADSVQSVTIVGPDAMTTDALSTSVFVMGVDEGLRLIEGMPSYDAIIIDADRKMHYSTGFLPGDDE